MALRIVLEPDVTEVRLSPGDSTTVHIAITNNSDVVDAFDLSVNNLDPSWYTLAPAHVSLFPKAQATVDLRVELPVGAAMPAGVYPFQVMAASRDTPLETANAPIMFYVLGASELGMAIEPERIIARKGAYTLKLTNNGNIERTAVLYPSDPDALLVFGFGKAKVGSAADAIRRPAGTDVALGRLASVSALTSLPSTVDTEWTQPDGTGSQGALLLTLPPASLVDLPLHVRTKRRIWFGKRQTIKFSTKATPPGLDWEEKDARIISGELVYDPIFAAWSVLPLVLRRVVMIALVLAVLGLLIYLLMRSQATPTGEAAGLTGTSSPTALTSAQKTQTVQAGATQTIAAQATASALAKAATGTAIARNAQLPANQTATAIALIAGRPKIDKLDFVFGQDGATTVAWEVAKAITVTLNGAKVDPVGSQVVDTTKNQSYVLIASNNNGQVSQSTGVFYPPYAAITRFVAEPSEPVCSGCEVTLRWTTENADQVTIDDTPVPDNQRTAGSIVVKPIESTDYVLTAQGAGPDVKRGVIVQVIEPEPTPTPR